MTTTKPQGAYRNLETRIVNVEDKTEILKQYALVTHTDR